MLFARQQALQLLRDLDNPEPPTPLGLALSLHQLDEILVYEQAELPFPAVPKLVRGILDAENRAVYNLERKHVRKRWVAAHEVGHYALEDHRELLRFCTLEDLSAVARRQLEAEANSFAATLLSHGDRFAEECQDSAFSFEMLRSNADRYELSYEAACRRFVEAHKGAVALLVWRTASAQPSGPSTAVLKYYVASDEYLRRRYPIPEVHQQLPPDHALLKWLGRLGAGDYVGRVRFRDDISLSAFGFFNQYDTLLLIGPGLQPDSSGGQ